MKTTMTTKLMAMLLVLFTGSLFAQQTYVPDDNFEQALIDQGYDDVLDDYVLTVNINNVTYLSLDNKNISDLTGIADFIALTFLYCSGNNLSYLDLSNNTLLELVHVIDNQLVDINISNNPVLYRLYAHNNKLQSMDLSSNIGLSDFRVPNNELTELIIKGVFPTNFNVTNNSNLLCIEVNNVQWWEDNHSGNKDVQSVFNISCGQEICDNNIDDDGDGYVDEGCVLNLVNFKEDCEVGKVLLYPIPDGLGDDIEVVVTDGSGNTVPLLTPVLGGAGNTRLSYETVSPLGDQENYTVTVTAMNSNAQITKTLTSSASTPPTIPAIVYNSVHGEWNVKARSSSVNNNGTCPEIFTLEVSTTSDFSDIIESVSYTKAHSAVWTVNNFLDVRDLCDVLYARVVSNKHGSSAVQSFEPWTWDGSLDNSHLIITFQDQNFKNALLGEADKNEDGEISMCEAESVTTIRIYNNNLISDVGELLYFANLEGLYLSGLSLLTEIDVTQNTELRILDLDNNSLSEIDVTQNLLLEILTLENNNLTDINVTNNVLLRRLFLEDNAIGKLDLTHNTELEILDLGDNNLVELDVTQNALLTRLDLDGNSNLTCVEVLDIGYAEGTFVVDDISVFKLDCAGITKQGLSLHSNEYLVYPNPFKTNIAVESFLNEEITIQVYSSLGVLVEEIKAQSLHTVGETLDPGNYMIKVISSNDIQTFSVVKD